MKIFIVGGTGVLGKRLVPDLIEREHDVAVLSRSEENYQWIKSKGATPVEVDIFDLKELMEKTSGYEVYIHMATSIPENLRPSAKDWEMNAKLRAEGVDNLVKVAKSSDCKLFIKESVNFHYGHRKGDWVDESTEIKIPIPHKVSISEDLEETVLGNVYAMEKKLLKLYETESFPVIILRFGWLYSHDSSNVEMISQRKMPIIGGGEAYWNMVTVFDAAKSITCAIETYENNIGEVYNIVDDEPVKAIEFLTYGTKLATGKSPWKIPQFLAKLIVGSYIVNFVSSSRRIKNSKAKIELNWEPKYKNYEKGLAFEMGHCSETI